MATIKTKKSFKFIGTKTDDVISTGFISLDGEVLSADEITPISANGKTGDDDITTGIGNDLAAGDMVGDEWSLVDGEWTYNPEARVVSTYGWDTSFNDIIKTGKGRDVLLGNGGNDLLFSGAGKVIINGGRGDDRAFGGDDDDKVNLEAGNDYAEGGLGNDTVNGGAGNDVIFGDLSGENLMTNAGPGVTTFAELAGDAAWSMTDDAGTTTISQSAATIAGETYTISFGLAANFSAGLSSATVEVLWNGEVVDTAQAITGAFQTFEVDVVSSGDEGTLSFRTIELEDTVKYNFDGPIISYKTDVSIGSTNLTVEAFAPGQSNLYQVIDGQLNVFDVATAEYTVVGSAPDYKINAVGFNIEDDLIYGVAKTNGTDSLGNAVMATDIVMIDASGETYRVGKGFYGDYVGDFDNEGNLWTFSSALNRLSVVDVDNQDAEGNPLIQHFSFPSHLFGDRTYDIAFNAEEKVFMAVVTPSKNGGNGAVVRVDLRAVAEGGMPSYSELEITGTLFGDTMLEGMPRGAYGAVFFDADGNLYYGLNNGDHDLNSSTGAQGAIYRVEMDWDAGEAYSEFMSETPRTNSNDGAVDPRSIDAFADIDAEAPILLRDPAVTLVNGGNDALRGGKGDDEIHGNDGDDDINGGSGEDMLFGDQGDDLISAGSGDDLLSGGAGNDKMRGQSGNDHLSGNEGDDYLSGGTDDDVLSGGEGIDKIVGGAGADEVQGGAGNDQLWGGDWEGDAETDTFVFEEGTGRDFIHDFEESHDVLDLTAFGTDMTEVLGVSRDEGWATIVDLSKLEQGQAQDKIIMLSVDLDALDADNFIF